MSSPARIILIGNGTLAARGLRLMQELGIEVPLILADSHDDGVDSWRESFRGCAEDQGYVFGSNLFAPANPNKADVLQQMQAVDASAVLSLQCRRILRTPLLELFPGRVLNLHNAPLPLLRGCDPFAWAIHDGLHSMGVSLHQVLDEGVDNGPVVAQRLWKMEDDTSSWDLYGQALEQAMQLLRDDLLPFLEGKTQGVPQSETQSTYHPMGQFDFSQLQVEWNLPAQTLSAWIRARIFPPFQLPWTNLGGQRVEILKCRMDTARGAVGELLQQDSLIIGARYGSLQIIQVRLPDARVLTGEQLVIENSWQAGSNVLLSPQSPAQNL